MQVFPVLEPNSDVSTGDWVPMRIVGMKLVEAAATKGINCVVNYDEAQVRLTLPRKRHTGFVT